MKKSLIIKMSVCTLMLVLFISAPLFAQSPETAETPAASENTEVAVSDAVDTDPSVYHTLSGIIESAENLEEDLKSLNGRLKEAKTDEEKKQIESEIDNLNRQKAGLERDFEKIVTGIDYASFGEKQQTAFDIKEEMLDLLKPVIQELKKMTETPRAVEKLRQTVAELEEKEKEIEKALLNIETLRKGGGDPLIEDWLANVEKEWSKMERQVSSQLKVASYQLNEKTKSKKSFLESSRQFFQVFFKSRGRNLFFGFLSFLIVFLVLRAGHRALMRHSRFKSSHTRTFYSRLVNVIYYFMTFLLSFGAFMSVLYLSGDWVLLSLAIIFILGILWTAKQGLPKFWEQIKFMLNLGTVKENQRLIYEGIPWKVVSLNLYSILENPALTSGRIHLPLRHLADKVSRECFDDEPWFPTNPGDWVLLSDGTRGMVIVQTPENVVLELRGGARKSFVTSDFLGMNPVNISGSFRIKVTFGIDYALQPISTKEVPEKLTKSILKSLEAEGHDVYLKQLKAEFKAAAASSLDYEIIADFDGKAAFRYGQLTRAIQRYGVDACNQHGWGIPFTQIVVHSPDGAS